jgi:hypothetical protein
MNDAYDKWTRENTVGWISTEPTTKQFALSPWQGEIGYNNIGQVVQYRNGVWELM